MENLNRLLATITATGGDEVTVITNSKTGFVTTETTFDAKELVSELTIAKEDNYKLLINYINSEFDRLGNLQDEAMADGKKEIARDYYATRVKLKDTLVFINDCVEVIKLTNLAKKKKEARIEEIRQEKESIMKRAREIAEEEKRLLSDEEI